jgi:hypothetical protein
MESFIYYLDHAPVLLFVIELFNFDFYVIIQILTYNNGF